MWGFTYTLIFFSSKYYNTKCLLLAESVSINYMHINSHIVQGSTVCRYVDTHIYTYRLTYKQRITKPMFWKFNIWESFTLFFCSKPEIIQEEEKERKKMPRSKFFFMPSFYLSAILFDVSHHSSWKLLFPELHDSVFCDVRCTSLDCYENTAFPYCFWSFWSRHP